MLVDLVGQLNLRYLATAFSSLVGSLTSYGDKQDQKLDTYVPTLNNRDSQGTSRGADCVTAFKVSNF